MNWVGMCWVMMIFGVFGGSVLSSWFSVFILFVEVLSVMRVLVVLKFMGVVVFILILCVWLCILEMAVV